MKITWKVDEAPTGRYRSFQKRSWPTATYADGKIAAQIYADQSYTGHESRRTDLELAVSIADYSVTPWKWHRMAKRSPSIQHAKDFVLGVLAVKSEWMPKPDPITDLRGSVSNLEGFKEGE